VAGALEALPELLVEMSRRASLVQEVTRGETFWSFAQVAARYRVTKTLGRDFFSGSTAAPGAAPPSRRPFEKYTPGWLPSSVLPVPAHGACARSCSGSLSQRRIMTSQ
jgi:hypothetical protein